MHGKKEPDSTIKNTLPKFDHNKVSWIPIILLHIEKWVTNNINKIPNRGAGLVGVCQAGKVRAIVNSKTINKSQKQSRSYDH